MSYLICAGVIVAAGLIGAVGLSILCHGLIYALARPMTNRSQYGMIFFFLTGPLGWLLGSLLGVWLASHRHVGLFGFIALALLLVLGGLIVSPRLGMLPFDITSLIYIRFHPEKPE